MSKIKNLLFGSLMAATLATSGCGTSYYEGNQRTHVPYTAALKIQSVEGNDPSAMIRQKEHICNDLVSLLKKEFDSVTCDVVDGNNEGLKYDIILRGYDQEGVAFFPKWGTNLDKMCRATRLETVYVFVDWDDRVRVESSDGAITTSPNFSHNNAVTLAEIFKTYIGNNGEQCKYWAKYNQDYFGPLKHR